MTVNGGVTAFYVNGGGTAVLNGAEISVLNCTIGFQCKVDITNSLMEISTKVRAFNSSVTASLTDDYEVCSGASAVDATLFLPAQDGSVSSSAWFKAYTKISYVSKISASPENVTFDDLVSGYEGQPDAKKVTLTNAGLGNIVNLSVALRAGDENLFTLNIDGTANSLAVGGSTSFTVQPKLGLSTGQHDAVVFVSCNGVEVAQILVRLDVVPAKPEAVFTATDKNSGTLSHVTTDMKYSVDGGTNWKEVTAETMTITGVSADNDIKIYQPGNNTADSAVQIIDVTQAQQPANLSGVACTTIQQNDGQITGVDATMEYRLSTSSEWLTIDGQAVTGLINGTYEVRVKASGTMLASAAESVEVGAHTCVAVGDWQMNETGHWKLCACGVKVEEAVHSGGTATCMVSAVCEVCDQPYGEKNLNNHTGEIVWTKTATTHSSAYDCCGAAVIADEAHKWENGVCSECGYECQHSGGEATCANKAVCDICGEEYGDVNASNHTNLVKTEAKLETHMTEGNIEYWYCDGCDKYFNDEAGTKKIALEDTVIPKLTEHSTDGTGWHSDKTNHWNTCECGEKLNETAHTFEWVIDKEATATEAGFKHEECKICGYEKAAVEIPATGTTTDPTKPNKPDDTGKPAVTTKPDGKTDSTNPQTGDNSNLALWIAVMLSAGAVLTGTSIYSRKKKYNR